MGMEDTLTDADVAQAEENVTVPENNWYVSGNLIDFAKDLPETICYETTRTKS
jgi:hypothetical protein